MSGQTPLDPQRAGDHGAFNRNVSTRSARRKQGLNIHPPLLAAVYENALAEHALVLRIDVTNAQFWL